MTGGSHGRGRRQGDRLTGTPAVATLDDFAKAPSLDELREFLEADYAAVDADPEFKERLRRELWELVRSRFGS